MVTKISAPVNVDRAIRRMWFALWPVALVLMLLPINDLWTRMATLAALGGLWGGALFFFWNKKFVRFCVLAVAGIATFLLILPGRGHDHVKLRESYVAALANYEGASYVWGGENRLGIDCSGLVRKGLIVAECRQGMVTLNPRLLREGLSMWWNDSSAKALGEEYQQRTRRLLSAESLNGLDHSIILPGDIAVTVNGIHTLAYLGEGTWIEADPGEQKVIRVKVPTENGWFSEPVNIMRWTQFDTTKDAGKSR